MIRPEFTIDRIGVPGVRARFRCTGARRRFGASVGDSTIVNGAEVRLGQLFDANSGRSFIAAFDHGVTLGPNPGSERALDVLARTAS